MQLDFEFLRTFTKKIEYGPFLNHEINQENLNLKHVFSDAAFAHESLKNCDELVKKVEKTALQLIEILKQHPSEYFLNLSVNQWTIKQITDLLELYVKEKNLGSLNESIISVYRQCIPLLIGITQNRSYGLCEVVKKAREKLQLTPIDEFYPHCQKLLGEIEKIAQDTIFQYRDVEMHGNPWTYHGPKSCRCVIEEALLARYPLSTYTYRENLLLDSTLWKIIIHDPVTFTILKKRPNSLKHFDAQKGSRVSFLNTMSQMADGNQFESLICSQYEYFKSRVIPQLDQLNLLPVTRAKIQKAWDHFNSTFKEKVEPPAWMMKDESTQYLLGNLYTFQNRRLYPNSDPEQLGELSDEKVNWTVSIFQKFNEKESTKKAIEEYKELLKDPKCTRYGLKAFLNKKISQDQFVSLCMAWSAVNVYDPEFKTTKIVHCRDVSIMPYYHEKFSEESKDNDQLKNTITQAIEAVEKTKEQSEQFVLLLEFDVVSHNSNQIDSSLMKLIHTYDYFFFPNKKKWVVPSFTLLKKQLKACYGSNYAKPIPFLGDIDIQVFEEALKHGNRPIQISMCGVGNALMADAHLTVSYQLLSNPKREKNDPSMWLHDLFHLNAVGAIPREHRLKFYSFALHIKGLRNKNPQKKEYKIAYKKLIDMQFLKYERASEEDRRNGCQEAFSLTIDHYSKAWNLEKEFNEFFNVKSKDEIDNPSVSV